MTLRPESYTDRTALVALLKPEDLRDYLAEQADWRCELVPFASGEPRYIIQKGEEGGQWGMPRAAAPLELPVISRRHYVEDMDNALEFVAAESGLDPLVLLTVLLPRRVWQSALVVARHTHRAVHGELRQIIEDNGQLPPEPDEIEEAMVTLNRGREISRGNSNVQPGASSESSDNDDRSEARSSHT